jgi:hypothetical protein
LDVSPDTGPAPKVVKLVSRLLKVCHLLLVSSKLLSELVTLICQILDKSRVIVSAGILRLSSYRLYGSRLLYRGRRGINRLLYRGRLNTRRLYRGSLLVCRLGRRIGSTRLILFSECFGPFLIGISGYFVES